MKGQLAERRDLNRGSPWPSIIGGVAGGLIGLVILIASRSPIFVTFNTTFIGLVLGILYGRILCPEGIIGKVIGGIIGGFCGLVHGGFLFAFIFTGFLILFYCYLSEGNISEGAALRLGIAVGGLYTLFLVIFAIWLAYTKHIKMGDWAAIGMILGSFIPFVNLLVTFLAARIIGSTLIRSGSVVNLLSVPYFAVPLLSFAGYFMGCKISEGKKPKEYIREIPEGGLLMSEDQNFPEEVSEDISPVAFSEKAMIQDLLGALNNKSLLLTKLESWKARAKGQDQLKAFGMIREMLEKETDIITAYIENQQARLDFKNLREFNQHIQKEKLKAQLAEEQYKQAELEEKVKRMKLEEEYKRLELQRKIEDLKRAREITESKIERIKKERLEKIGFQEEIRKVKTMRLADRVEYLHNWKKEIRKKYSSEEAEDIIDELERMLVEEGLRED
ncbi:hypothetical protein ES702_00440 [subsurface metagenome]